jgi:hypothetical protein
MRDSLLPEFLAAFREALQDVEGVRTVPSSDPELSHLKNDLHNKIVQLEQESSTDPNSIADATLDSNLTANHSSPTETCLDGSSQDGRPGVGQVFPFENGTSAITTQLCSQAALLIIRTEQKLAKSERAFERTCNLIAESKYLIGRRAWRISGQDTSDRQADRDRKEAETWEMEDSVAAGAELPMQLAQRVDGLPVPDSRAALIARSLALIQQSEELFKRTEELRCEYLERFAKEQAGDSRTT